MGESSEILRTSFHLRRDGWTIGDVASVSERGSGIWLVAGLRGELALRAEARTRTEAWRRALEQAGGPGTAGASQNRQATPEQRPAPKLPPLVGPARAKRRVKP